MPIAEMYNYIDIEFPIASILDNSKGSPNEPHNVPSNQINMLCLSGLNKVEELIH